MCEGGVATGEGRDELRDVGKRDAGAAGGEVRTR